MEHSVAVSGSENPRRRREAFEAFSRRTEARDREEAAKSLPERLRSRSTVVKMGALDEVAALGTVGQPLLIDILRNPAKPGDRFVVLPLVNDPAAAQVVAGLLEDPAVSKDADIVCACLSALGRTMGDQCSPLVADYLEDERWAVRDQACRVVAREGTATISSAVHSRWNKDVASLLRGGVRGDDQASLLLLYWARNFFEVAPELIRSVIDDVRDKVWPKFGHLPDGRHALAGQIGTRWPEIVSEPGYDLTTLAPNSAQVKQWRAEVPE